MNVRITATDDRGNPIGSWERDDGGALINPTEDVLQEVSRERQAQEAKWGQQNHPPSLWFLVLSEEVGELAMDLTKSEVPPSEDADRTARLRNARTELVQIAAVAVAMVESLDRNELSHNASS